MERYNPLFKFSSSLIILLAFSPLTAMMENDSGDNLSDSPSPKLTQKQLDEETHYWFLTIPGEGRVQGKCSGVRARHMERELKSVRAMEKSLKSLEEEYEALKALPVTALSNGGSEISPDSLSSKSAQKHKLQVELYQVTLEIKEHEIAMAECQLERQRYMCIPSDASQTRRRGIDFAMSKLRDLSVPGLLSGLSGTQWRLEQEIKKLEE